MRIQFLKRREIKLAFKTKHQTKLLLLKPMNKLLMKDYMEHQQVMKICNQLDSQNMQKFIKNQHLSNKKIKLKKVSKKVKDLIMFKSLWI